MNKFKNFFKDNKVLIVIILFLNFILMNLKYVKGLQAIDLFYLIFIKKILNNYNVEY